MNKKIEGKILSQKERKSMISYLIKVGNESYPDKANSKDDEKYRKSLDKLSDDKLKSTYDEVLDNMANLNENNVLKFSEFVKSL